MKDNYGYQLYDGDYVRIIGDSRVFVVSGKHGGTGEIRITRNLISSYHTDQNLIKLTDGEAMIWKLENV